LVSSATAAVLYWSKNVQYNVLVMLDALRYYQQQMAYEASQPWLQQSSSSTSIKEY
jgi:hypothetical protein